MGDAVSLNTVAMILLVLIVVLTIVRPRTDEPPPETEPDDWDRLGFGSNDDEDEG